MTGARFLGFGWEVDLNLLAEIAEHLSSGGLVAMPTETVYGFGGVPSGAPLKELQRIKGRGPEKPFLLLIPDPSSVSELRWTSEARELAEVFWPGALTLVLNDPHESFPLGVRSPRGGVAVRVTPHPMARALVGALAGPIVSTSANVPAGPPALSAREVLDAVGELRPRLPFWILDGGLLDPSLSSTIVDCTGGSPVVRRVGAIPVERLRCVLPELGEPRLDGL